MKPSEMLIKKWDCILVSIVLQNLRKKKKISILGSKTC